MGDNKVGQIGWVDLTVPNAKEVSEFYQQVVGWKAPQLYTERVYNMHSPVTETQVAILVQKDEKQSGVPACWLPYIIVENLQESIDTCLRLGGKVVENVYPGGEASPDYCVIQDPAGAYVALTTVSDYTLEMGQQSGQIGGLDFTTSQAEQVRDFYQQVAGWKATELSMGDYADYFMVPVASDTPVAGICHKRGENATLPSCWLIYVVVEDLARSGAACKRLGGRVVDDTRNNFWVIQDPAGAYLTLLQIEQ